MAMHVLFQFPGKGEVVAGPSMVSSELVGQESAFTRCKLLAAWETAEDEGGVGRWREGGEVEGRRRSGTKEPKGKSDRATVTGGAWCQMIGSEAQCQRQRVLPRLTATFKLRAN